MKFLILYSENNKQIFPSGEELKNELKCSYVCDFKNLKNDLINNEDWKLVNEEFLGNFNYSFVENNSTDRINAIWEFNTNSKYYNGKCKAYILSEDIDKRLIDWWSLKHSYSIRKFKSTDLDLNDAIENLYLAYAIEGAHQYSSARYMREQIIEEYSNKLSNSQLIYLNKLTEQEDKIKRNFKKIQMNLITKAKKILTKKL
jgi:hypothetical protein